ncbi:MAG: hypothetical protein GX306_03680 [Clostridiales bacterium]|nr:hypothetical protein [Clostridiales bacterium]
MYFIAIAVGLILLLILWSQIEQTLLVTSKYKIRSEKLNHGVQLRFVVLSDLHNHSLGKNNEKLIHKVDSIRPDFIVIAGDLITKRQACYPSNAFTLLKNLSKKYKIYYGYGNHELYFERLLDDIDNLQSDDTDRKRREALYSTWVEYKSQLKKLGIIFLENQSLSVHLSSDKSTIDHDRGNSNSMSAVNDGESMLMIHGLSLSTQFYKRGERETLTQETLTASLGEPKDDSFHLLIAHNPIYFNEYTTWGANLTISGHVHGGLVRLPFFGGLISPQIALFPKFDAGRFTKDGKDMIISRGLGTHSCMLRLFNPPELVIISLQGEG